MSRINTGNMKIPTFCLLIKAIKEKRPAKIIIIILFVDGLSREAITVEIRKIARTEKKNAVCSTHGVPKGG